MLAPNQIKNYQFQPAGDGLYRADEVDAFFGSVSAAYEKLYQEHGDLLKRVSMLAEKVKDYRDEEELIKKTLLVAQKKADEIESSAKQYSESTIAAADKRAQEMNVATEERARVTLANANQESAAILKSARETAEKTGNMARSKAESMLNEAKSRAQQMLTEAQKKRDEVLGSLETEVQRETQALAAVRGQSKTFKAQILDSYRAQIDATERLLQFTGDDDSIARSAVEAAAALQSKPAEPVAADTFGAVDLPQPEIASAPASAPAQTAGTFTTEEDDLFITTFAETVNEEPEPQPQPETFAPVQDPEPETNGFSFVQDIDKIQPTGRRFAAPEIPEVELADIDEIFTSALSTPKEEPAAQEPEFDFVKPFDDLKDKYSAAPDTAEPAQFSDRIQTALEDSFDEEATQTVPAVQPREERQEDKPEKKRHRFSLFSRYEDDDDDEDDEDEEEEDDEEDDDDDGFQGFFRK